LWLSWHYLERRCTKRNDKKREEIENNAKKILALDAMRIPNKPQAYDPNPTKGIEVGAWSISKLASIRE
jgi:hypothetical protein